VCVDEGPEKEKRERRRRRRKKENRLGVFGRVESKAKGLVGPNRYGLHTVHHLL
jgi:hypothetical protein